MTNKNQLYTKVIGVRECFVFADITLIKQSCVVQRGYNTHQLMRKCG